MGVDAGHVEHIGGVSPLTSPPVGTLHVDRYGKMTRLD
jgi:hypothetical protein